MTCVLDSSAAFKWVVPEPHEDKASRLRDDYRNGVLQLLAPDVFPLEIAHALTKAERQNRITAGQASILWADVMATAPQLLDSIPVAQRGIAIASQIRIAFYDCLYVALAEHEGCQFITGDDKLLRNLQRQFGFIVPLSAMP